MSEKNTAQKTSTEPAVTPADPSAKFRHPPETPLLDNVQSPADLKNLSAAQLKQVADELRLELIDAVSTTGGHLGASLGVVELSVALHAVFETPRDRLIWDVGHQSYPHKILTERRDRIRTIRQPGGISGFTNRAESEYDPFGAGHSSTSVSAALGMAVARDLKKEESPRQVVAVIGDGALSAGMVYEAMNNAGSLHSRMIVILNDNEMSIAPPVGAMSAYLSKLISSGHFLTLRDIAAKMARRFPKGIEKTAKRVEELARGFLTGGTLFEALGFYYVGPVDGHNLEQLLPILRNLRDADWHGPVLLHVVTEKGHGYKPAEAAADKYHGVVKFDPQTGIQMKTPQGAPSYTQVFSKALLAEAGADPSVVAITAAMPAGTGLDAFAKKFPERCFDVGIAEQHAVTFAAGLAAEGIKPFCALYSTFLQRGYDQVVHDVALQDLPVRFMIDRAGFVGADGATHAGIFDTGFLAALPGMVIMSAADEADLMHMVRTAASLDHCPSAVRYPRGEGTGIPLPERGEILPLGKGRIIRQGEKIAVLSVGTILKEVLKAADKLTEKGISPTIADARFIKPFDKELVTDLARRHDILLVVEEGSVGGFASLIAQYLATEGLLDGGLKFRPMCIPDKFIEHNTVSGQLKEAGLTAEDIFTTICQLI